jgi:hypothetical protein
MKLVSVGCGACGAEWEDIDRGGIRAFCTTCGSKQVEKLLFGGKAKPGDLTRVPREVRIEGAGRLLGIDAIDSARQTGDWEHYESIGNDPNDLEAEYWLARYRSQLETMLLKEGIVLTEEEENKASTAFRDGWDLG